MSRASDLEAARLAAERLDARCDALIAISRNAGLEGVEIPGQLNEIAQQLLAEATYISEQRRSGWKSRSDAHTAASRILEQWAKDLAAYLERDKPPARPPLETIPPPTRHADLDPANGPISAQITSTLLAATGAVSPAAVERLAKQCRAEYPYKPGDRIVRCGKIAGHTTMPGHERHAEWIEDYQHPDSPSIGGDWGPEWDLPTSAPDWPEGTITPDAATRVRLAIEAGGDTDAKLDAAFSEPVTHITAAPANYAWCDATTGLRGYVGTANCPDCREAFDNYQVNGVAVKDLPPARIEPAFAAPETIPATELATVAIPQFSEPGPAPVRQTQVAMTFEAIREHGMARARGADHRSVSQFTSFAECGVHYALSDLEAPAWWNVGGTAVHYACEHINRQCWEYDREVPGTDRFGPVPTEHAIETLWTNCLNRSVSETIGEHPTVGPDQWRAARKGVEGYDWWRTNGVDMVQRWIARLTWLYEQGWTIATIDGKPAIEFDCPMWIGPMWIGEIKVENIIDLVMTRQDGTYLIIDAKSGAKPPASTHQLGQYGHALETVASGVGGQPARRVLGAYWLARTDELRRAGAPDEASEAVDLRTLHPWSEIEYLIRTMDVAESQGLYLPNRTTFCGGCGVAGLCPVGPR